MKKRIKKPSRHRLYDRDISILKFLWSFKVSTTAMLHQKFFSGLSYNTAYNTLQKLRKYKYIATKTNEYGKLPVWMLEKKGFEIIKSLLPPLRANTFKSENKEHDLIVSAIHLGEFLKEPPSQLQIVTEQMLRSYSTDVIPKWVPNVEEHIPDGYWRINDGGKKRLISLEVELNYKSKTRYDDYGDFYKDFDKASRVLWVLESKSQAKGILDSMYSNDPEFKVHNFVLLKDVYKNGWRSEIISGIDKGKTIVDLFPKELWYNSGIAPVGSFESYLCDRRLTYRIHSKKQTLKKSKLTDSMGVSA